MRRRLQTPRCRRGQAFGSRGSALGLACVLAAVLVPGVAAQTSALPVSVQYLLIAVLVMFSGLFSGLTLGLLGLDKMGLQIVIGGGEPTRAAFARKILPLREDGNLLLCTLLLGNVAVNSLLSILMADLTNGAIGFLTSTVVIVIFGEIIPQASFSRYALYIGAKAVPVVVIIQYIFYPVAKPIALALDYVLGDDLGTIFSHAELTEMVTLHVRENAMDEETGLAITGALKYKQMKAREVMTSLELVFMLSVDEALSYQTIAKIFKSGFSRIPVYRDTKQNIVGLLYVKDLIFIDPDDRTPVANFTSVFGRPVTKVFAWTELGDCMQTFRGGRGHMALVVDVEEEGNDGGGDPVYCLVGIITLEDIIEEILGEEIVDEYDTWHDNLHSAQVVRDKQFDMARLRVLHSHSSRLDENQLSIEQRMAVKAHFAANVPQLQNHPLFGEGPMPDDAMERLVHKAEVYTMQRQGDPDSDEPARADVLYIRGRPSTLCILVLDGRLTVKAGKDEFRSDAGPWSVLGGDALRQSLEAAYVPDFTAFVASDSVKVVQFSYDGVAEALSNGAEDGDTFGGSSANGTDEGPLGAGARNLGVNNARDARIQRRRRRGAERQNRGSRDLSSLRMSVNNQSGISTDEQSEGSDAGDRRSFGDVLRGRRTSPVTDRKGDDSQNGPSTPKAAHHV